MQKPHQEFKQIHKVELIPLLPMWRNPGIVVELNMSLTAGVRGIFWIRSSFLGPLMRSLNGVVSLLHRSPFGFYQIWNMCWTVLARCPCIWCMHKAQNGNFLIQKQRWTHQRVRGEGSLCQCSIFWNHSWNSEWMFEARTQFICSWDSVSRRSTHGLFSKPIVIELPARRRRFIFHQH